MGANWTKFTEWLNTGTEPSSTLKKEGFKGGYKPPASVFNYFFNRVGVCIGEIQTEIDNLQASEGESYEEATTSSAGLMSASDKSKLNGIAANAEVNQNAYGKIKVGDTTLEADEKQDTLTLVAGDNIFLTTQDGQDWITISARSSTSSSYTLPTAGKGTLGGVKTTSDVTNSSGYTACPIISGVPYYKNTTYSNATTSSAGLMSASDKTKLNELTQVDTSSFATKSHTHSEYVSSQNPHFMGTFSMNGCSAAEGGTGVALGVNCFAGVGQGCFASGQGAQASGSGAAAFGYYTNAEKEYQLAVGSCNDTSKDGYFVVGNGTTYQGANAFRVGKDGTCYGAASFKSSGADYAEMFEWQDGNPDNEDRRGLFVTLDGEKIRLANADDEILGIISAMPSVVGDVSSEDWQGKYLKDIFGAYIWETVEIEETTDKNGVVIPAHTEKRRVLNPDYDPECEYVSRDDRQEWDAVGLMGKLVTIDDGTCEVNGYCKVGQNGVATKSTEKTAYRVMSRIDKNHIKILAK